MSTEVLENQRMSTQIDKLATALSKAQSSIEAAKKSSLNPFYKSDYADLGKVWSSCKSALGENGLSVSQIMEGTGKDISLVTILMHSSGQWIRSTLPLPIKQFASQEIGSALTYMRRYALSAIVGIVTEEDIKNDDDGETSEGRGREEKKKVKAKAKAVDAAPPPVITISENHIKELQNIIGNNREIVLDSLRDLEIPAKNYNEIPLDRFEEVKQSCVDQILAKQNFVKTLTNMFPNDRIETRSK